MKGRPQVRLLRPALKACWRPQDPGSSEGLHRGTGPSDFILMGGEGSR